MVVVDRFIDGVGVGLAAAVAVDRNRNVVDEFIQPLAMGRRSISPAARWAFWCAPTLPVLVSGYLLALMLT